MDERRRKRSGRLAGAAMCAVLAFTLSTLSVTAEAVSIPTARSGTQAKMLVPVGRAIGVKLFAEGVLVVALSEEKDAPAHKGGIKIGDLILSMNGTDIDSTEHLQSLLAANEGQEAVFDVRRGTRIHKLTVTPLADEKGTYRLGAWIRDSMAGIGTVTFYDPQTGTFAALGHGITDVDTGRLMPLSRGSVMAASVKAVRRGESGAPGELRGDFDLTHDLGVLYANTDCGIFGVLSEENRPNACGEALSLASRADVHAGKAIILANCEGGEVCEYEIEIEKLYSGTAPTRNLLLRVTDPALLALTGGIVQGMSGSPIVQDGKLVGAVTHVLVDDPTRGYGILIENMLAAGGLGGEQPASA